MKKEWWLGVSRSSTHQVDQVHLTLLFSCNSVGDDDVLLPAAGQRARLGLHLQRAQDLGAERWILEWRHEVPLGLIVHESVGDVLQRGRHGGLDRRKDPR